MAHYYLTKISPLLEQIYNYMGEKKIEIKIAANTFYKMSITVRGDAITE
jgi:hypothetical protein